MRAASAPPFWIVIVCTGSFGVRTMRTGYTLSEEACAASGSSTNATMAAPARIGSASIVYGDGDGVRITGRGHILVGGNAAIDGQSRRQDGGRGRQRRVGTRGIAPVIGAARFLIQRIAERVGAV